MRRDIMIVLAAVALCGFSCSTNQPGSVQADTDNIQATGSLQLNLSNGDDVAAVAKKITDTAVVEHVWITIKEVQLHIASDPSENGWKTVATPNQKFDFLELVNGLTAPLDLYALPAGHYTQIRLMLGDEVDTYSGTTVSGNSIVVNGETFPITIPSAYRTGIKCVRSFFIEENEVTEICLQFDVLKAVHYAPGNGYMMRPAYRTFKCDGSATGDDETEVTESETIPDTGSDDKVKKDKTESDSSDTTVTDTTVEFIPYR